MGMPGMYRVFESRDGELIALANQRVHRDGFALGARGYEDEEGSFTAEIEETSDAYIGYPFDYYGHVSKEKITLMKSDWTVKLTGGDPVVGLHIPPDEPFGRDVVEDALSRSRELLKNHYPEYEYKAFFCGSWMLDPQLPTLLGEEKNISRFCRRFYPLYVKDAGRSVFTFVFQKPNANFEISELPENTSLERTLKNHYLSGKAIYETFGFFLP